jgi:hypothetical protein
VILLTNDEAFESELTLGSGTDEGLLTLLHFNGKTLTQNEGDGNFESLTVAPGDAEDKQLAIDRIQAFRPHVVVSTIGPDLNDIWFVADASWRPYYILSPQHSGSLDKLMEYVKASSTENNQPIHERFVGVDIAGSEDQELLKAYRDAIIKAFPNASPKALQAENTYDAVYFLSYAMVAGSKTADPFGLNIAGGMTKIIGGGSTFNVGVAHAPSVMADLLADKNVTLFGALGPPNWDSRGFRRSTGALYCFKDQGTFPLTAEFHVGHLDEVTKKLRLAKQYATLAPPCLQWLNLPAPPP